MRPNIYSVGDAFGRLEAELWQNLSDAKHVAKALKDSTEFMEFVLPSMADALGVRSGFRRSSAKFSSLFPDVAHSHIYTTEEGLETSIDLLTERDCGLLESKVFFSNYSVSEYFKNSEALLGILAALGNNLKVGFKTASIFNAAHKLKEGAYGDDIVHVYVSEGGELVKVKAILKDAIYSQPSRTDIPCEDIFGAFRKAAEAEAEKANAALYYVDNASSMIPKDFLWRVAIKGLQSDYDLVPAGHEQFGVARQRRIDEHNKAIDDLFRPADLVDTPIDLSEGLSGRRFYGRNFQPSGIIVEPDEILSPAAIVDLFWDAGGSGISNRDYQLNCMRCPDNITCTTGKRARVSYDPKINRNLKLLN